MPKDVLRDLQDQNVVGIIIFYVLKLEFRRLNLCLSSVGALQKRLAEAYFFFGLISDCKMLPTYSRSTGMSSRNSSSLMQFSASATLAHRYAV